MTFTPAADPPATVSPLFTPCALGPLRLRNRVVMAPMTRERALDGSATPDMLAYYRARARGGVGLIITEGMAPDAAGAFGATVPRLWGRACASWQPVVRAVQAEGARIFAQIWHVGAFDPSLIGMADSAAIERVSPSGLAAPGRPLGRSMGDSDIADTIAAFGSAAAAARAQGFDGVEIHGAHGYLPDQFLWADTNRRTDRFGGDAVDRTRFAAELLAECRRRTAPDYPLVYRFSQWKQLDYQARLAATPQALGAILQPLALAGADMFHASTRRYWEPAFEGDARSLAAWTRHLTGKPVIAVGSVTLSNPLKSEMGRIRADIVPQDIARLEQCLARGDFDLIAVGRALIANPDWAAMVQAGRADSLRVFTKDLLASLD